MTREILCVGAKEFRVDSIQGRVPEYSKILDRKVSGQIHVQIDPEKLHLLAQIVDSKYCPEVTLEFDTRNSDRPIRIIGLRGVAWMMPMKKRISVKTK